MKVNLINLKNWLINRECQAENLCRQNTCHVLLSKRQKQVNDRMPTEI